MRFANEAIEALLSLEGIFAGRDGKVRGSYYLEFWRRVEVLDLTLRYCSRGLVIVDIGAAPFITSCALKKLGYNVVAVDIEPEKYMDIAEVCEINVIKVDLERDPIPQLDAGCVIFTEVIEHLNPYYAPEIMKKINKAMALNSKLILTTPNIASLFRRLKLLLGVQPQYRYHVHEYTKNEVEELLAANGFKTIRSYYSTVNDLTYVDVEEPRQHLAKPSYLNLAKHAFTNPNKTNVARLLAYPLVKLVPSLRQLIVIVAEKIREPETSPIERW
ncbi:MAG: class I SAM-dependent methyltransferase [Infirmifilum sp.]